MPSKSLFLFSFYLGAHWYYQHQTMASLNLNSTETTNIDPTTIGISDNHSVFVVVLFIMCLFVPSFGCTIFLLFHIGRLHVRH